MSIPDPTGHCENLNPAFATPRPSHPKIPGFQDTFPGTVRAAHPTGRLGALGEEEVETVEIEPAGGSPRKRTRKRHAAACVIYLRADEFLRQPLAEPSQEPHQGGDLRDTSPVKAAALEAYRLLGVAVTLSWGMPVASVSGILAAPSRSGGPVRRDHLQRVRPTSA
jgi:hypothetical protein